MDILMILSVNSHKYKGNYINKNNLINKKIILDVYRLKYELRNTEIIKFIDRDISSNLDLQSKCYFTVTSQT